MKDKIFDKDYDDFFLDKIVMNNYCFIGRKQILVNRDFKTQQVWDELCNAR